jgi:hypothetical protein
MQWNVSKCVKNECNGNLKGTIPITDFYRSETTGKCVVVQLCGSMMSNDAMYTCEIKFRIAMAKAALNRKKALFTSKLDLHLRKKLVKCYIWSTASCGAKIWIYQKVLNYGNEEGWRSISSCENCGSIILESMNSSISYMQ